MDVTDLSQQMACTKLDDSGILSFEGLALRLDNEEQAKEVIDKIKAFKDLRVLKLEGNTIGADAAKGIAKALESQPTLKRALWKDMFTGRKEEIPKALNFLGGGLMLASAQLVELDLSDNALGPIGIEGLLPLLRSRTCYTLKQLILNNNGLGLAGGKALAISLVECLKSSSKSGKPLALRKFVSGRNRLENGGAAALSAAFKAIGTLEEISMPQNGINHGGIAALADAFAYNNNLTKIDLNDNTFTEVGSISLAKVLTSMHGLKSLDFGDCMMYTKGAIAVAKSLADGHSALERLCLAHNEIKRDGALEIVSAIKNKSELSYLDINGNNFGKEGIELIKIELQKHNKLDALTPDGFDSDQYESEEDEDDSSIEHAEDDSNEENYEDDDDEEYKDIEESEDDDIQHSKHLSPLLRDKDPSSIFVKKDPVADFLADPDMAKLEDLGKDAFDNILQNLEGSSCKGYIDAFIKISQLVTSKDEKYHKLKPYTDCIMERICQLSEDSSISMLTNSVLAQFGLIKSEDKSYVLPTNMVGPFLLLAHSVDQKYFPVATRRNLNFFLTSERNTASLQKGGNELLNVLYKNRIQ